MRVVRVGGGGDFTHVLMTHHEVMLFTAGAPCWVSVMPLPDHLAQGFQAGIRMCPGAIPDGGQAQTFRRSGPGFPTCWL